MLHRTFRHLQKAVALGTLLTFISTNTAQAAGPAVSFRPAHAEAPLSSLVSRLEIPESLGVISERLESSFSAATVVHLQDAHSSLEAQEQIRQMLHYLKKHYQLDFILVEGGIEELDGEKLRSFEKESWNQELAELLVKQGVLSGSERFLLDEAEKAHQDSQFQKSRALGIESPEIYGKNLKAFRSVLGRKDQSQVFLDSLQTSLLTAGSSLLNPKLHKFFKEWTMAQNRGQEILRQLETLKKYAANEIRVDFDLPRAQIEWPQLVRLYKLTALEKRVNEKAAGKELENLKEWAAKQNLVIPELQKNIRVKLQDFYRTAAPQGFTFQDYPELSKGWGKKILQEELNALGLFEEITHLADQILNKLAVSQKEKEFIQTYKNYLLLSKILKLELTNSEYEKVLANKEILKPSVFAAPFLQKRNNASKPVSLDQIYSHALLFYQDAKARDQVMFEKAIARMQAEKKSNAILISGGFHSDGLKAQARKAGLAYVEVQPRIRDLSLTTDYEKAMLLSSTVPYPKVFTDGAALEDFLPYIKEAQKFRAAGMKTITASRAKLQTSLEKLPSRPEFRKNSFFENLILVAIGGLLGVYFFEDQLSLRLPAVIVSQDKNWIAEIKDGVSLRIRDADTAKLIYRFDFDTKIIQFEFSPKRDGLVVVVEDDARPKKSLIKFFNVMTSEELSELTYDSRQNITIRFSRDGKSYVVTASDWGPVELSNPMPRSETREEADPTKASREQLQMTTQILKKDVMSQFMEALNRVPREKRGRVTGLVHNPHYETMKEIADRGEKFDLEIIYDKKGNPIQVNVKVWEPQPEISSAPAEDLPIRWPGLLLGSLVVAAGVLFAYWLESHRAQVISVPEDQKQNTRAESRDLGKGIQQKLIPHQNANSVDVLIKLYSFRQTPQVMELISKFQQGLEDPEDLEAASYLIRNESRRQKDIMRASVLGAVIIVLIPFVLDFTLTKLFSVNSDLPATQTQWRMLLNLMLAVPVAAAFAILVVIAFTHHSLQKKRIKTKNFLSRGFDQREADASSLLFSHLAVRSDSIPAKHVLVVLGNPYPGYAASVVKLAQELRSPEIVILGKGGEQEPERQRIRREMLEIDPALKNKIKGMNSVDESMHTGMNVTALAQIVKDGGVSSENFVLTQIPTGMLLSLRIFEHQWNQNAEKMGFKGKSAAFYAAAAEFTDSQRFYLEHAVGQIQRLREWPNNPTPPLVLQPGDLTPEILGAEIISRNFLARSEVRDNTIQIKEIPGKGMPVSLRILTLRYFVNEREREMRLSRDNELIATRLKVERNLRSFRNPVRLMIETYDDPELFLEAFAQGAVDAVSVTPAMQRRLLAAGFDLVKSTQKRNIYLSSTSLGEFRRADLLELFASKLSRKESLVAASDTTRRAEIRKATAGEEEPFAKILKELKSIILPGTFQNDLNSIARNITDQNWQTAQKALDVLIPKLHTIATTFKGLQKSIDSLVLIQTWVEEQIQRAEVREVEVPIPADDKLKKVSVEIKTGEIIINPPLNDRTRTIVIKDEKPRVFQRAYLGMELGKKTVSFSGANTSEMIPLKDFIQLIREDKVWVLKVPPTKILLGLESTIPAAPAVQPKKADLDLDQIQARRQIINNRLSQITILLARNTLPQEERDTLKKESDALNAETRELGIKQRAAMNQPRNELRAWAAEIEAVYRDVAEQTLFGTRAEVKAAFDALEFTETKVSTRAVGLVLPIEVGTSEEQLRPLFKNFSKNDTLYLILHGPSATAEEARHYESAWRHAMPGTLHVAAANSQDELIRETLRAAGQSKSMVKGAANFDSKYFKGVGFPRGFQLLKAPEALKKQPGLYGRVAVDYLRAELRQSAAWEVASLGQWMQERGISIGDMMSLLAHQAKRTSTAA